MTSPAPPGHLIAGRYRLVSALGSGGVGRVWLAVDELLGRQVAVKEFSPPAELGEAEREMLLQRTLREAKTAARLSHPNVVTIYDAVEDGGRPWIVMEMIPARSLRDLVHDHGPLEPHQAASIGLQVLAALRAAHALGIAHRDVKPANVLIDRNGRAVLADFGIARTPDTPTLTRTGMLVGSPSYIAPERAHGDHGGPESDLWSLGATLYAAVEGRPPYDRPSPLATLTAVVSEDPDPPRRCGALWPVVSGLLARDPARRLSPAAAERMLRRVAGTDAAGSGGTAALPELFREPGRPDTRELPLPFTVPDQPLPAEPRPPELHPADHEPAEPVIVADPPPPEPAAGEVTAAKPGPGPAAVQGDPVPAGPTAISETPAEAAPAGPGPAGPGPAGPGPAGPSPARAGGGRAGRRWLLAVIAAAAAAAVITAIVLALNTGRRPPAQAGAPPSSSAGSARPAASASGAALPRGYHRYHDPTGFSIAMPAGWRVSHQGRLAYLLPPSGNAFLLIDQSDHPKPDPLADWQQQEAARSGSFPGYHRIRLQVVSYPQAEKAADWEFTYYRRGVLMHVLNRNVLANAHHAYALYWSTRASQWNQDRPIFAIFARTFQPAR